MRDFIKSHLDKFHVTITRKVQLLNVIILIFPKFLNKI